MKKRIILFIIVLSATNLLAQEEKKLELAVGGKFLAPISDEKDSPENWESLPGLTVDIKRMFTLKDSTINPYLQLEAGLFIPMAEDQFYSVFPELCGSVGVEFLISRNAFLFIDVGYMLGITTQDIQKLISGNVGINFKS